MKYINIATLWNFRFNRFLLVGATNTVLTYFIYIGFTLVLNYLIAYTLSYIIGIAISYYLNSAFVFQTSFAWTKAVFFSFAYIGQYCLGMLLLYVLVSLLNLNQIIAPLFVVSIMTPIVYLFNKKLLQDRVCV